MRYFFAAFFTGIFQRKYLKFALTKSLKIKYNTPILFCAKDNIMARKPAEKNEPDFENTLKQLEEIVSRLENNELSLEDALKDFEQGIKLAQLGQERLQQAEQRIQILLQKSESAKLSDYQPEE
ncbi:exodeoxyribonuclease vii small subunit,putative' [Aggregatibacter actinomycetemcomitans HK1651]|nr:exodeoxyribonuclease vii small subunit,putative' [Aggregatibacter actinomycetemcomitans HK1651]